MTGIIDRVRIRKAAVGDIKAIHGLLHRYSHQGDLVPRPLSRLYDHARDFFVAEESDGRVMGCCALQFCWEDLAEVRSLAVETEHRGMGVAGKLVRACIDEARSYEISQLFLLTFKPDFFSRFGFFEIERTELPVKIWADCMHCVRFPDCDGIAMMKTLKV